GRLGGGRVVCGGVVAGEQRGGQHVAAPLPIMIRPHVTVLVWHTRDPTVKRMSHHPRRRVGWSPRAPRPPAEVRPAPAGNCGRCDSAYILLWEMSQRSLTYLVHTAVGVGAVAVQDAETFLAH